VRYADDLVVIHEHRHTVEACRKAIDEFLAPLGLRLKPSKTRIAHTLNSVECTPPGFDFLGFNIRQHAVGKYATARNGAGQQLGFKTIITPSKQAAKRHYAKLRSLVKCYVNTPLDALASELNPVVRGWSLYYSSCVCTRSFSRLDALLWRCLYNHMRKRNDRRDSARNVYARCMHLFRMKALRRHTDTKKKRHVKVQGYRSPFDGDWLYWATRLGRHPETSQWKARKLKVQRGRCGHCGLPFGPGDILEMHHLDGNLKNHAFSNRLLIHGHCHDQVHRRTHVKG
jgi:RNA-directed DNA polymerase